jgi:plasmid segregation protein ParM
VIIGIDLGNYAVKTSKGLIFPSKCSRTGGLLKNTSISTGEGTFYIGEGSLDTEYRKAKKEHIRTLFLYACAITGHECIKAVVGLPLSQYKQDRDALKNLLLSRKVNDISINGRPQRAIIEDVEVYPEGLAAIYGMDFEGVLIDIGGRTTDCCEVIGGKVSNPFSLPQGTLNLDSDFIKALNSRGLDLRPEDAAAIIRKGLRIDGEPVDITPATEVFRQFVNDLVLRLQIEYSIRTRDVLLIGGGCQLLYQAFKNRIPAARMIDNPVWANAMGLERVGAALWK